ncbi:regulatory protein RecX [Proteinivorax tanatarense]|uniref:Regulatory protein RecX n=1 Tax=Proteinivorax tanatarense TaxID=1260629 RepID=A0AAU7VQT3_9FIRM
MKKAIGKALRYLSYRARTELELKNYLDKKGVPQRDIEEIISELKNYGYINDDEYATQFINYQAFTKLKGPQKIKFELTKRGISRETMDSVFESLEIDFLEIAKKVTVKKKSTKTAQQLYGHLIRRGFYHNHAMYAIKALEKEEG